MTDETLINEKTNNDNESAADQGDNGDRISIAQWILLFAALGAVIYFSPMLFKLLPQ